MEIHHARTKQPHVGRSYRTAPKYLPTLRPPVTDLLPTEIVSTRAGSIADPYEEHQVRVVEAAMKAANRIVSQVNSQWTAPLEEERRVRETFLLRVKQITNARDRLLTALAPRELKSSQFTGTYMSAAMTADEWLKQTGALTRRAANTNIPWLNSNKLLDRKMFLDAASPLLARVDGFTTAIRNEREAELQQLYATAFDAWLQGLASSWLTLYGSIREDNAGLPAHESREHHAAWRGRRALDGVVPRPVIQPGRVDLLQFHFTAAIDAMDVAATRTTKGVNFAADGMGLEFPVALDLDLAGGIITDSRDVVENSVVQLLSTLPAGMLKIDAVDPIGLGESLNFLYGLNDAGDKVLGDAVWTTAEHASKLLVELEKHVTFVTQKYLQGTHGSLTEYNVAAGEVAEPYRAVLLYDFPSMFTRDGRSWDDESLQRLKKLVGVGRRSGVFFFVLTAEANASRLPMLTKLYPSSPFDMPTTAPSGGHMQDLELHWNFLPDSAPIAGERDAVYSAVLRGLDASLATQVGPSRVAELATKQEGISAQRGIASQDGLADPDDPRTWWRGSSQQAIVARFGRMGASGVAQLEFNSEMESSALVGGRTGSGKSFLLHAIIMDLVTQYGPDELELYLVDLKEGIEFKQYADARLPHARAVAIASNREFAISILRAVDKEIADRGRQFNAAGGGTVNLAAMRKLGGVKLPRILLVVDEFHKLFEKEDALKTEAEQLLERIIKEGRAFGVHAILGSQSIAMVGAVFRSLAGQIFYRLVLASSEADSTVLLGEGNPDAQLLTKAGEGILNAKAGLREANNRFQASYWAPEYRAERLADLRTKADGDGFERGPVVFDALSAFSADQLGEHELGLSTTNRELRIPIGAPMSLEPVVWAELDRAPGRNLLIVSETGLDELLIACTDLAIAGVSTTLVEFGVFDPAAESARDQLQLAGVTVVGYRPLTQILDDLIAEIERRTETGSYAEAPRVVALAGLHRARDFSSDGYGNKPDSLSSKLEKVLTDGPEVGIFTIAWADRPATVERRLTSTALREFTLKLVGVMSADDSRRLTDSDRASTLRAGEFLFDDRDRATTIVLRRLEFPGADWIASRVAARARS